MSGFAHQGRLLLCRHGEAEGNLSRCFLGHRDDRLTDLGRRQAESLAELLAPESVTRVISSPLRRALDSAHALCARLDLALETDARLIEQDFGDWEGLDFAQAQQQYGEDFRRWLADATLSGPTRGEPLQAVGDRVASLWHELEFAAGQTYVLVGHGSCLQALLCRIFAIPTRAIWPFRLANGSLTEVQFTRGGPSMTRLSVT